MLTRYGISESDLPPDSVIINRPLSFYEQHRAALLPAMTIMLVLFGIILLLMYLLRVKQRSESLLRQEKLAGPSERPLNAAASRAAYGGHRPHGGRDHP